MCGLCGCVIGADAIVAERERTKSVLVSTCVYAAGCRITRERGSIFIRSTIKSTVNSYKIMYINLSSYHNYHKLEGYRLNQTVCDDVSNSNKTQKETSSELPKNNNCTLRSKAYDSLQNAISNY